MLRRVYFLTALGIGLQLALTMTATPANAQTLSFDDITTDEWSLVPDGYGGFHWGNCGAFDVSQATAAYYNDGSGYEWGVVSPPYVAYSKGDNGITVSRDSAFVFLGAYFAAAWSDDLTIVAEGRRDGQKVYELSFEVDPWGPLWVDFPSGLVDSIDFQSSGGVSAGLGGTPSGHFVMDEFTFVPEPTTLALLALGALAVLRRRR